MLRNHSDERPFSCNKRERRFKTAAEVKLHQRAHTEERSFQCSLCEKLFNTSEDMRQHIRRTYINVRPFKCDLCGTSFKASNKLKRHKTVYKTVQNVLVEKMLQDFVNSEHSKTGAQW